jgi:hypothetical protein
MINATPSVRSVLISGKFFVFNFGDLSRLPRPAVGIAADFGDLNLQFLRFCLFSGFRFCFYLPIFGFLLQFLRCLCGLCVGILILTLVLLSPCLSLPAVAGVSVVDFL